MQNVANNAALFETMQFVILQANATIVSKRCNMFAPPTKTTQFVFAEFEKQQLKKHNKLIIRKML